MVSNTRSFVESLVVSDRFSRVEHNVRKLTETPIISDRFSQIYRTHHWRFPYIETIVLRDILSRRTALKRSRTETLAISESFRRSIGRRRLLTEMIITTEKFLQKYSTHHWIFQFVENLVVPYLSYILPLYVDGSTVANPSTQTTTLTLTLSASKGDLVMIFVPSYSLSQFITVASITSPSTSPFSLRQRGQYFPIADYYLNVEEWSAVAEAAVMVITVTFIASADYQGAIAFGVAGANTSSPFDPNPSIPPTPATGYVTSLSVSVTTSFPNDMILGCFYSLYSGAPSPGTGYSTIQSIQLATGAGVIAQYQLVSTRVTSFADGASSGQNYSVFIGDAIQARYTPLAVRDQVARTSQYFRKLFETSAIMDFFTRVIAATRKFTENLGSAIKDVFSYIYTPFIVVHHYVRSFVETLAVQDLFKRVITSIRSFTENLSSIKDVFSYVYTPFIVVHHYVRSFVETLAIQDIFKRTAKYARQFIENFPIRDVFSRAVKYARTYVENLRSQEVFQRTVRYFRPLTEPIRVQEIFKRAVNYTRRFTEQILISDVLATLRKYARSFAETLPIQDVFKRTANYSRRFAENLSSVSERFLRRLAWTRKFVEYAVMSDVIMRSTRYYRRFREDLSALKDIYFNFYRPVVHVFVQTFTENLSAISEVLSRIVTIQDIINELISLETQVQAALAALGSIISQVRAKFKLRRR